MSLHPNPGVRADPLKQAGLKATLPRMRILEIFLAAQAAPDGLRHFTAEDVYRRMLHDRTDVGQATVYRVLAQLERLDCGKVEEFHDASIESRQAEIAHAKGFRLQEHALSLYGTCTRTDCPSRPQRAKV